jgi:hypothetical protein
VIHVCIFAHGQIRSGKIYNMMGENDTDKKKYSSFFVAKFWDQAASKV